MALKFALVVRRLDATSGGCCQSGQLQILTKAGAEMGVAGERRQPAAMVNAVVYSM